MRIWKAAVAAGVAFLTLAAAGEPETTESSAAVEASSEAAARAVIDAASVQLLAVLRNASRGGDERLHALEEIIHQRFDLARMSRYVLGLFNESRLSEK